MIRIMVSNKAVTDYGSEKKFLRRTRFFIYKYNFLIKTKKSLGFPFIKTLESLIHDFIMVISNTSPMYNRLSDLNLLPDEGWLKSLLDLKFDEKRLTISGNPFLDKAFREIQEKKTFDNSIENKGIRILIVTDSLVEHGFWSSKEKEQFLKNLFLELKKLQNSTFSLKIHPSSESKLDYENLLQKLQFNFPIYQHEDLWDLISEHDIVISYGHTHAHTELACGIKFILLDEGLDLPLMPLVQEGISSGHIVKCKSFKELIPTIQSILQKKIEFTDEFIKAREKLFFKFDGKSGERAANAILETIELHRKKRDETINY
jgi:hypothetical protein